MRRSIIYSSLLWFFSLAIAQDAPFTVTRPEPGDTLTLSSSNDAANLYVDWTVAPGSQDEPVYITLQQGDDLANLETIDSVDGSVPNTGSYTWTTNSSTSLQSGQDPGLARTACNYTVRLLSGGLVAYSQYFTIINEADGPVPDDTSCPVEQGISRPQIENTSTTTVIAEDDTTGSNSSGADGSGISTSTLAVAIVIPIVVLLIILGVLLWLGLRRGWFVKLVNKSRKQPPSTHTTTYASGQWQHHGTMSPDVEKKEEPAPAYDSPPQELHSDHRPWEAEAHPIYQLEGDERDARWEGNHIREPRSNA